MTTADNAGRRPREGEMWLDNTAHRPILVVEIDDDDVLIYDPYKEVHYSELTTDKFLASYGPARLVPLPIDPTIIAALSMARTVRTTASSAVMLADLTYTFGNLFTDATQPSTNLCIIAAHAAAYAAECDPDVKCGRDDWIETILVQECCITFLTDRLAERPSLYDEDMRDSSRAAILITRLMNVVASCAASKNMRDSSVREALIHLAVDALSWAAYNISDDYPAGEGFGDITSSI